MKWSLAAQLRLGFATMLLMVFGIFGVIWWIGVTYRDQVNDVNKTHLATTTLLAEAESALWQLRCALPQFMIGSTEDQQRILGEQDQWYAIVEERLAAYGNTAPEMEERRALTSLRAAYQRYKQARPKFFELWQAGEKDGAIAWNALTTTPFGAETVRAFDAQIALQRSLDERDQARSEKNVRVVIGLMTAITIALLALLVVGYAYAARTLRPIRALRDEAVALVRDRFGEDAPVSMTDNEVAALESGIRLMSSRLVADSEMLRRTRERLDFLLTATPAVIYAAKPGGDYGATFISANIREQLGHAPEDFLNDSGFWANNIHPEDRERVLAHQALLFTEGRITAEYRFRHQDGSWRWMHDKTTLVRDAAGEPKELVGSWIDITARVTAEKEKELAQERLKLALAGGRLAVWDADAASGKVWLSEQWAELLGESPHETWTTVDDLIALTHSEDRQRLLNAVVAVMKGERPEYAEEHRVRTITSEWRWIQSRGRVTERASDGRAVRMSGTNLDITLRREAELKLERTQAILRDTLRVKTEFMNNVTHELRTPLNSVIGFAELLKDEVPGPLNAKQAAFAADILASGRHLLKLVEGILELSRLDEAGTALERELVEIGAALAERVAANRNATAARGVTIALDVAPDAGSAKVDPTGLRRILDALLDNAIKFNREGGTVEVRARRNDGQMEISVADTGIGIAREDLAKLFKPLVQLDAGAGTAAWGWASRSRGGWPSCTVARSKWKASRGKAARSRCVCPYGRNHERSEETCSGIGG